MDDELPRTRAARDEAERALIRVVHHYGSRPEFVLLGGVEAAADAVLDRFRSDLPSMRASLDDLLANFADPTAQGPRAYVEQTLIDHPEVDRSVVAADAILAVERFHALVTRVDR